MRFLLALLALSSSADPASIGRAIFQDRNLSQPPGQACISCHQPEAAFADPRRVSPGALQGRAGRRNAPSLMYAALIPALAFEDLLTPDGREVYAWEGGLFHDGRARDLFEQVQQPFFSADEMNLPNAAEFAKRLRQAAYANLTWAQQDDEQVLFAAYQELVAFLREPMFRPFDARIDDFLAGKKDALNPAETRGLAVFRGAGGCADCHFLEPTEWPQTLLSDFGYDNLGVPSRGKPDPGLGVHKGKDAVGQFRVPSLRNVALTAPYMHNGAIATLHEVMEFYNKRDLEPDRWGPTDYPRTVNHDDMGNLELSEQQVSDLVALMEAFTDHSLLAMRPGQLFPIASVSTPSSASMQLYFPGWTHRLHRQFRAQSSPPSSGAK
ncbi:MAG: cytochrome c peroxidase [Rhodothermales bacterium]|jgi:cytochrome c peroxidase